MLLRLPQELLLQIHLYALNPFFPQTHSVVHSAISSPTPTYVAQYLLTLYQDYGPGDLLVRSLRHPICSTSVAKEIRRIWDKRRGYVVPSPAPSSSTSSTNPPESRPVSEPDASNSQIDRARTPNPTAPALTCSELPRRMFRRPSTSIDPLLTYLFETYTPSANSHKGYPLCRAVLTANYALVEYLLHHGADPSLRSYLALETAIRRRDLKAVRMLVERKEDDVPYDDIEGRAQGRERRRKKRRRLSDRVNITPRLMQVALEEGSEEIVNYFVEQKGIVPPLRGILAITKPSKTRHKPSKSAQSTRSIPRPSVDVFGDDPRYA